MTKHYTIPFFILHRGCPFKCIFCDQKNITGKISDGPSDVQPRIDEYLSTISADSHIEVGFFGGTFTGLEHDEQLSFVRPVKKYIDAGKIKGIRISTRPDLVSKKWLETLMGYGLRCVELGVQSVSDKVLEASRRGYTRNDIENASRIIKSEGLVLGHQMMLGLPLSTWEDECLTARAASELGAEEVRIYPALVIKNTGMAEMWRRKEYAPLEEREAVERSARLILYFDAKGIKVIKCGLHPSEGLLSGEEILAGPFHAAFRLKAESLIFNIMLKKIGSYLPVIKKDINVWYNGRDEAAFYGFEKENAEEILKITGKENIRRDDGLKRGSILLSDGKKKILLERKDIAENVLTT